MHKHLSCTLSRLSSSEPVAIIRVSGDLPGLHPIHLYWFRARMTEVPLPPSLATPAFGLSIPPGPADPHRRGARMTPFLPRRTMVASGPKRHFAATQQSVALGSRSAFDDWFRQPRL